MGEYHTALSAEIGSRPASGDIPVSNSLVTPVSSNSVPVMHSKEGATVFVRREFIRNIGILNNASVFALPINPGYNTFPWLYTIARNYQTYRITGLAAEYVPTSGYAVASTSAALGTVSMVFVYNTVYSQTGTQWPATTLTALLNTNGSVSMSPAAAGVCYMECDPALSTQPVRQVYNTLTGIGPYSQQNFDAATLIVRTEGSQNTLQAVVGQLWFTYEVVLMEPLPRNPALPLTDPGEFEEAENEWDQLIQFTGPFTQAGLAVYAERMQVLHALFNSLQYAQHRAHRDRSRRLCELKCEGTIPVVAPAVVRLIEQVESLELAPLPLPLGAEGSLTSESDFEESKDEPVVKGHRTKCDPLPAYLRGL